jgi:MYXO-CTERM domain-containing protein
VIFDAVAPTGANGKQIKAMATMPDPQYDGALNNDVGLIHLATPVTDRTPAVINRVAASAPVGVHLEMIGYGVHTSGGNNAGVEYFLEDKPTFACANTGNPGASDTNLLCWTQSDLKGKCEGDSGGPSFAMIGGKKVQVGITSVGLGGSGAQTACDGSGADTRIDHVIAWLDSTVGDSLKCAADGVCVAGCANDPDCPKCTVDKDCTGTDQACDHGQCVPAPLTPGGAGYACTKDTDCNSGMCGQVGADHKCTQACDPTNNMCPANFDCLASTATSGECWPGANAGKSESSCSAGNNSSGPMLFFLGLGAFLLTRRRRTR